MREFRTFYSDNEGVIGMFFKKDWVEVKQEEQWKPSEEHFQGLRRAITKAEKGSDAWNSLIDLYEQLKKL